MERGKKRTRTASAVACTATACTARKRVSCDGCEGSDDDSNDNNNAFDWAAAWQVVMKASKAPKALDVPKASEARAALVALAHQYQLSNLVVAAPELWCSHLLLQHRGDVGAFDDVLMSMMSVNDALMGYAPDGLLDSVHHCVTPATLAQMAKRVGAELCYDGPVCLLYDSLAAIHRASSGEFDCVICCSERVSCLERIALPCCRQELCRMCVNHLRRPECPFCCKALELADVDLMHGILVREEQDVQERQNHDAAIALMASIDPTFDPNLLYGQSASVVFF